MESAIKDKSSGGAPPPTDKEFDLLLADGDDFVDLDLEALANIIADCPAGSSDLITTDDDLFNPSAAISKSAASIQSTFNFRLIATDAWCKAARTDW